MDKDKILALADSIGEILSEHPGGEPNEIARLRVRKLADSIVREDQNDGYITDKAHCIRMQIDRYYSTRKHLKYRRGNTMGVEFLRNDINSLLDRIRSWNRWEDSPNLPNKP